MSPLEAVLVVLICMNLLFSIWQTRILSIVIENAAYESMHELDSKLALAIQSVLSDLPIGDIEPPNPFQTVMAQILKDKMSPPIIAKEISRDDSGKFS